MNKKYWIKKLVVFTETPTAATNLACLGSTVEMVTVDSDLLITKLDMKGQRSTRY